MSELFDQDGHHDHHMPPTEIIYPDEAVHTESEILGMTNDEIKNLRLFLSSMKSRTDGDQEASSLAPNVGEDESGVILWGIEANLRCSDRSQRTLESQVVSAIQDKVIEPQEVTGSGSLIEELLAEDDISEVYINSKCSQALRKHGTFGERSRWVLGFMDIEELQREMWPVIEDKFIKRNGEQ